MQRTDASPELSSSNQRSVIAKSVSNQIVSVEATLPNEIYEQPQNLENLKTHAFAPGSYQDMDDSMSSPPSRTQFFMSPSSTPPHPAILASNTHYANSYESYCGYDLLKSKRKPIPVPSESKDDAYWERRRRNNESAKRSREIRRIKETQTNKRIMYLEQENVKLQTEVGFLREELKRLRSENELLPYLVRRCK